METTLLQTKFYVPPPRPELVSRPHLIERLNAGLGRKLTLISAPAGFGKTTLVSEWIQALDDASSPIHIAWLSLDESDNDLNRFLVYVIAALQTMEARHESVGNIAKGALSALQSPQPPPVKTILTTAINEISAIPNRVILILDDYHLIETQPVHDALAFLITHLPPNLHLVIATREDPPLSLARLRARGQLTELRAADLRFTSSEASTFLNQMMGLDLSAEDVAALESRTEGWIAGLQLAALALRGSISMQGRSDAHAFAESFTGSHRYVLDYLIEEVLGQQPESIQVFMLQTAILERLNGSLCDAVRFGLAETPNRSRGEARSKGEAHSDGAASAFGTAQHQNGQAILEMLERANLFIVPLDEERRWYRYHHLFADLLRQRLRQMHSEQLPELHRRASVWYGQNGFIHEAIEHSLRAKDFEHAARLIEERIDTLWGRGENNKLRHWLDSLPENVLFAKPYINIFQARLQYLSGQFDAAEQTLHVIEQATDVNSVAIPDRDKLRARAAVVQAGLFGHQANPSKSIHYARQALQDLPPEDYSWRGTVSLLLGTAHDLSGNTAEAYIARVEAKNAYEAAGDLYYVLLASHQIAITLRAQGRLQQTIEICEQQWQFATEVGLSETNVVGWLLTVWGETLAELDDLEGAIARAQQGLELAKRIGEPRIIGGCAINLAKILFSMRHMDAAQKSIHKVEIIDRESHLTPWMTAQRVVWQVRIWLAQDKLDMAAQLAEDRGLIVGGKPRVIDRDSYSAQFDYLVLARILIAQGHLDEAQRLLGQLLEMNQGTGRTSIEIEVTCLQALIVQAQGNIDQGITLLEKALSLAEPGGFVHTFVDEGPPMARLLYEALARGTTPDYVQRLLAAFPTPESKQPKPPKPQMSEQGLVEPLSQREIEVLQLVAEGLTNPEIASRLYLSLNTIKGHTRNIYGKLGVHSRTQAVALAQRLGLLTLK